MIATPTKTKIDEAIEEALATPSPSHRRRRKSSQGTRRSLIVHHGPNRHEQRSDAKTSRTKETRYERHELKIEMKRQHRQRKNLSFKMNRGGQFRQRGAA